MYILKEGIKIFFLKHEYKNSFAVGIRRDLMIIKRDHSQKISPSSDSIRVATHNVKVSTGRV